MKNLIILSVVILISGCSPCNYVAKHPECFRPDTVKITNTEIKTELQTIRIDSITYDTIVIKGSSIEKTVYLTKTIHKTDTILTDRVVDRVNPINETLKAEKDRLQQKNKLKNIGLISLGGLILLLLILYKLFK